MNDTRFDIISAFLDGEPVDPDDLARTLAHPDAREQLADFLKLRAVVAGDGTALPRSLVRLRTPRVPIWSARVPLPVAVALALLFGAGSFAVSQRAPADAERPPSASRTVRFDPGVDWQTVSGQAAQP